MTQYKLVPVEPTREMIEAAFGAINYTMPEPSEDAGRVYAAMLSAAPSPDGEEVERVAKVLQEGLWYRCGLDVSTTDLEEIVSALPRRETEGPDYKAMFEAVEKRLQECKKNLREWRLIALNDAVRNRRVAKWLSAALEDPSTCNEMKADIRAWFDAAEMLKDKLRENGLALSLIDKLTEAG